MSLVSLDYVKQFLKVVTTSDNDNIQIYLDMASGSVVQALGYDVIQTSYPGAAENGRGDSGFYNGNGRRRLYLRNKPITAITNVWFDASGLFDENPDGSFTTASLLVYGTDYILPFDGCLPGTTTPCCYAGCIERTRGAWPLCYSYVPGMLTRQTVVGQGNIKIAYTAGYPQTAIPQPIRSAVCMLTAFIRRSAKYGGGMLSSESLGAYSYSLVGPQAGQYPELGSIRGMIAPYRHQPV